MTNIALYYYLGRGVREDKDEAVRWWTKAANLDDARACYNLGICYRDGIGVGGQDLFQADNWLRRAIVLGHPNASDALEQLKRQKRFIF